MTRSQFATTMGIVLALSGCGTEEETVTDCTDVPMVTYENFGGGFIRANCQPCHGSKVTRRHDAPDHVSFDTLEDIQRQSAAILHATTGSSPTMPKGGGVSTDERHLLDVWIRCWNTRR